MTVNAFTCDDHPEFFTDSVAEAMDHVLNQHDVPMSYGPHETILTASTDAPELIL